jgi:hypothetical protein
MQIFIKKECEIDAQPLPLRRYNPFKAEYMRNLFLFISFMTTVVSVHATAWIRINQLGYLPASKKVAVFISEEPVAVRSFALVDAETNETVATLASVREAAAYGTMKAVYRLDFSDVEREGNYVLKAADATSPRFAINNHVYDGTADFLLQYMRQQRCGYNPFVNDSCHTHDAYIIYHPTRTGQPLDVRGGWHDAGDYLQYTTTSANAIYQMMFAYQQHPETFGDAYDANGLPGANGIPDVVDEIRWGMDWLNRMNPAKGELYNQIADDRDHIAMRFPNDDKVDYGYGAGLGRPVYFCSGEPQQRGQFMNATTGVASTAGKFASCFALGATILQPYYPTLAAEIKAKADDAYQHGVQHPGVCQTASVRSPYIYEEDNWTDDMELAATELYNATGNADYLAQAVEYGRREPITPWMGADSARHYQWYPFMNMGHYQLAKHGNTPALRDEFVRNLRAGIARTYEKAADDAFLYGIPAIWCSNNLTTAMLTQCRLYRQLTGDTTYAEMEAALCDWLFGCNPWGTSMIVGLPSWGDSPAHPHSAYVALDAGNTPGGLVDGPVYATIFNSLRGVHLEGGEDYARFQPGRITYHDDLNDYASNEPTMDGTASLVHCLAALQADGMQAEKAKR